MNRYLRSVAPLIARTIDSDEGFSGITSTQDSARNTEFRNLNLETSSAAMRTNHVILAIRACQARLELLKKVIQSH